MLVPNWSQNCHKIDYTAIYEIQWIKISRKSDPAKIQEITSSVGENIS